MVGGSLLKSIKKFGGLSEGLSDRKPSQKVICYVFFFVRGMKNKGQVSIFYLEDLGNWTFNLEMTLNRVSRAKIYKSLFNSRAGNRKMSEKLNSTIS